MFAFSRTNYMIMIIGIVVIFVGYLLMIGGGTDNPHEFSEDIFSFRRLSLSPLVIVAGFIVLIYSILHQEKPRS